MIWDERMDEAREPQIVLAAVRNEREPRDSLVRGTCKLVEFIQQTTQLKTT